jgi:Na+/H+-dicarboxylate symporter
MHSSSSPKTDLRASYDVVQTPNTKNHDGGKTFTTHIQDEEMELKQSRCKKHFFGIPGILAGALIGIILGCAIQTTSPSEQVVSWIGIPGELFIRAIKCLVTPLVFCSLIVGMADMLAVGKAGKIGWRTALLYMFTTVVATCEGMVWVLIFRPLFGNRAKETEDKTPVFALGCDKPGYFLTHNSNGNVTCSLDPLYEESKDFSSSSKFFVTDINKAFAQSGEGFQKRTLTQALQGQLFAMVPSNITLAFSEGTLLSIIMFSIPFGVAISLLPKDMKLIANFFREINMVFMKMITWIIMCTPIAIISLLSSSIAVQPDLKMLISDVGLYVLCVLSSLVVHTYIFYPILLRTFVKINPYKWIMKMLRAQLFAFGCASSMATLPIVMECIDATKEISQTLSRFVLSLGATIGMDGAALGYPIAIVFMAEAEGIGSIVGSVEYFLIILVSTIGAIGSGPVPAAGIVMTMTIWTSVFPSVPLPSTFAFIVATDWFVDRFQTAVNVTCDTIVCRIVAEQVGETMDPELRESLASVVEELVEHNAELKYAMGEAHTSSTPAHL